MAESVMPMRADARHAASSSTMESRPPESATASLAPGSARSASAEASAASTEAVASCPSAGREFLELAITEQLVLARLEKRVDGLLLHVVQCLGQGLLQRGHHRRVVAVRAAERLVHHLVDQAERLQAWRRDAQRLRG